MAELSPLQANELFELRAVLEGLAARLAAHNATPQQVLKLESVVEKGVRALKRSDPSEVTALNAQFHHTIVEISGNQTLGQLAGQLRDRMEWAFSRTVSTRGSASWTEHRHLVEAIAANDEVRAEALAIGTRSAGAPCV